MNFKKIKIFCSNHAASKFKFFRLKTKKLNPGAIILHIRKKLSFSGKKTPPKNQSTDKYYTSYYSLTYTNETKINHVDEVAILNTYMELGDIQQIDECLLYDCTVRHQLNTPTH